MHKLNLQEINEKINSATEFIESKNYYYEKHICGGEEITIKMDYKFRNELSSEIVLFGFCPKCGICCYHNDYENKGF